MIKRIYGGEPPAASLWEDTSEAGTVQEEVNRDIDTKKLVDRPSRAVL